ncbi:MAG: mannose-6-phosphate isomerase-like protein (cupin superfamily) [Myxococcota bacterium]|jgi:mannose-6-phosphate isomerase-like protein (cupin superfamily)
MTPLNAADLVVHPGQGEATASDMKMIFRPSRLSGHFSIMEGEVRPGELLAFHSHVNEDQHMYIIEGELNFEVGGVDGIRFTAGPGSHVLKPRGSSHGFWNLGDTTARYIETSTEDGFEKFIDGRAEGLASMLGQAQGELDMSFEIQRSLEVMKEFSLTGLAGANLPPPHELLADSGFRKMLTTNPMVREFVLHLGGVKLREAIGKLL